MELLDQLVSMTPISQDHFVKVKPDVHKSRDNSKAVCEFETLFLFYLLLLRVSVDVAQDTLLGLKKGEKKLSFLG